MTGAAAQLCGDRSAVGELGYSVDLDGIIKDATGGVLSHIGTRKCVLSELSTAATFIARGYSTSFAGTQFAREAERTLSEVEASLRSLYSTRHKWNACSHYKGIIGHQLRFWLTSVALGFT
jgi:hypothetical protein